METETKVQHTAGPWNFHEHYHPFDDTISVVNSEDGFHYKTITIAKGATRLAEVIWDDANFGGYPLVETVEEMKANARLILAAPELLEALKSTRRYLAGRVARSGTGPGSDEDKALEAARAAIAKAEGRE